MLRRMKLPAILLLFVFTIPSLAATPEGKRMKGVRGDILAQLNDNERKLTRLAEAIPADKYGWRPAADVRSIGEVFLHVAGGNYVIASQLGSRMPEGIDWRTIEKSTRDKAEIIRRMRASFDFVRRVISETPEPQLERRVRFFGQDSSVRGVLLAFPVHASEHLGQSIAYARMNGIVPPWSATGE